MYKRISILLLIGFVASCSNSIYIEPVTEVVSTISISHRSIESPRVEISSNCKKYQVLHESLERRSPAEKESNIIKVAANEGLTIHFSYSWIGKEKSYLRTKSAGHDGRIEKVKTRDLEECSGLVSFIPEVGKHYEVFFSLRGAQCVSNVAQAVRKEESMGKNLYKVSQIKAKNC